MCVTPRGSGVVGSGVVHTLHLYRIAEERAAREQTKGPTGKEQNSSMIR